MRPDSSSETLALYKSLTYLLTYLQEIVTRSSAMAQKTSA